MPVPGPEVLLVLRAWRELMVGVRALLTVPPAPACASCSPPSGSSSPRAGGCSPRCRCTGIAVDAVVVNRLLPAAAAGDTDPWRTAWTEAAGEPAWTQVRESFLGIPLLRAPYLAGEPIGADALDALAAATGACRRRPARWAVLVDDVDVPRMRVEADGADFVLTLPLPLVSAGMVGMARREDDLLLEVGGQRRVVTLPSVLRRCVVAECGRRRAGACGCAFERDEELWASGR